MDCSSPTRIAAQTLREIVANLAPAYGFDLAGVTSAVPVPELEYFPQWVAEGRAGEMSYLERRNEQGTLQRSSLTAALPWARSVIVCAVSYDFVGPLSTEPAPPGTGWIARYAQPGNPQGGASDYHTVLLQKLRALESALHAQLAADCGDFQSRSYVDTGPLIERVFAQYAGLGWTAKNTCLIHPEIGSWLYLATLVTSLELVGENDARAMLQPDRCGSCTRCIDACPTGALDQPYRMDASRCIAYLTIEKRGTIAEDLRQGIGRNVFGCDICQDVCPWNRKARRQSAVTHEASASQEFTSSRDELINPSLSWLGSLDQSDFNRLFRGSPVERTKWRGLMRNVAIAMGNSGQREHLPQLATWSAMQQEPSLAEAAQWASQKISARPETLPAGNSSAEAPD